MSGVVTVPISRFSSDDPPHAVLETLIRESGSGNGSADQRREFLGSETAAAFVQFVYDSLLAED